MAAAFFGAFRSPTAPEALSAGTQPAEKVHPEVVEVMKELGLDLSRARPRKLDEGLAQEAGLLVTMGCGDKCPYVPGLEIVDWPLKDPKGQGIEEVRRIRDEVRDRVADLLRLRGWAR